MTRLRHKKSEQGITLLMAILILSAITAIVFSISTIALNEIRTNADLTKTEPVIRADEGIAEDSLFRQLRGFSTLPACSSPSTTSLNSVNVSICAGAYFDNPYTFDLVASQRRDFYLVNPTNQSAAPGYTSASVTMTGGSTANVYLCDISVVDCPSTPSSSKALNTTSSTTWSSNLDPSTKYQLIVINGAGSVGSFAITTAPNGLPSGTTTIDATGSKQSVTRKIQVLVPQ